MSSVIEATPSEREGLWQYRALSMWAVAALVVGIMSIPALFFDKLLVLSLIGVLLGWQAWRRVHRLSDELTGRKAAIAGLLISGITLVGGGIRAGHEYATEIPEGGFQRLDFAELQADPRYPQLPIPPAAIKLDGQKVFVKGYVHPAVDRRNGIKEFVLVPDMKTCCFGGQPALTDMIEVTLRDPLRIDYSYGRRKLAGTLRVSPYKKALSGLDGVYYQLDAEWVR